jgi:hypothetical protein
VRVPDSAFVPQDYKTAIAFLKENLGPGENFMTLTNEASWYYYVGRPCPSRFLVVWFAMPDFYQREVVRDLETKGVKYILYRNSFWTNSIDSIPNEKRLPILFRYVNEHYRFCRDLNGNEIWIKVSSTYGSNPVI